MINLSPEICLKLKQARREAKLSQSLLAAEVGCKQSALSMFEQGDGTKLNDEVIERLAKKFGVDLKASTKGSAPASAMRIPVIQAKGTAFCPNPKCPTNRPYTVEGRDYFLPDLQAADPAGGRFCAMCGELLERRCPNCGAPVHVGAICSLCGEAYVAV